MQQERDRLLANVENRAANTDGQAIKLQYTHSQKLKSLDAQEFAEAYKSFHVGEKLANELATPCDKSKSHPAALSTKKNCIGMKQMFKVCAEREFLLMKRSAFVYILKMFQIVQTVLPSRTSTPDGIGIVQIHWGWESLAYNLDHLHRFTTEDVKKWWIWGYLISPLMYSVNSILFAPNGNETLIGHSVVRARRFFPDAYWYWIGVVELIGFIIIFNICYNIGLEIKYQGSTEDRLVLLKGVSGDFRPVVLIASMGVTGAGKTTLMDVLAGRKTGGYVNGDIKISGYPKKQETFVEKMKKQMRRTLKNVKILDGFCNLF
ncbi:hypothetical protein P3L10_004070 [Capsicum annuum]